MQYRLSITERTLHKSISVLLFCQLAVPHRMPYCPRDDHLVNDIYQNPRKMFPCVSFCTMQTGEFLTLKRPSTDQCLLVI